MDNIHKYDSIINLPHHQSPTRRHMSMEERAAQFAPFAALTGYDGIIAETQRLTESWVEPDEEKIIELNEKTAVLMERLAERPEVSVTYFRPDRLKSGGAYITCTGRLKWIDQAERYFSMADGTRIRMERIADIKIIS